MLGLFLPNLAPLPGFRVSLHYTKFSPRTQGWKIRKELMKKRKEGMIHTDGLTENAHLQHVKA